MEKKITAHGALLAFALLMTSCNLSSERSAQTNDPADSTTLATPAVEKDSTDGNLQIQGPATGVDTLAK